MAEQKQQQQDKTQAEKTNKFTLGEWLVPAGLGFFFPAFSASLFGSLWVTDIANSIQDNTPIDWKAFPRRFLAFAPFAGWAIHCYMNDNLGRLSPEAQLLAGSILGVVMTSHKDQLATKQD